MGKAKRNPKQPTDREVLRKLFPKEAVEYIETQLKEADADDK